MAGPDELTHLGLEILAARLASGPVGDWRTRSTHASSVDSRTAAHHTPVPRRHDCDVAAVASDKGNVVAPELVIQTARAGEVVDCGDGDGHGAVTAALLRSLRGAPGRAATDRRTRARRGHFRIEGQLVIDRRHRPSTGQLPVDPQQEIVGHRLLGRRGHRSAAGAAWLDHRSGVQHGIEPSADRRQPPPSPESPQYRYRPRVGGDSWSARPGTAGAPGLGRSVHTPSPCQAARTTHAVHAQPPPSRDSSRPPCTAS